jgi:hypothetical protein
MTSIKQIDANRRNAQLSTGPRSSGGKTRSSLNATRHGLTAETVVTPLEDLDDYAAFELAITADFDARTGVERELVLRLSSLLWRLRRATAFETGLLQIQATAIARRRNADRAGYNGDLDNPAPQYRSVTNGPLQIGTKHICDAPRSSGSEMFDLARSFLSLSDLDSQIFDRLSRYEASLWRQVGQVLFTIDRLRATSFRSCY